MAETLDAREEAVMMAASKRAADLIAQGEHPTDAVEKIARDEKFGPGRIRTLAWACNTASQLAQMRSGNSILDKFASFDLADPDLVVGRMYPSRPASPAAQAAKTAVDADYQMGPYWLPDRAGLEAQRRDLSSMPMVKEASVQDMLPTGTPEWRMQKAYGGYQRLKSAFEETRRLQSAADDKLMSKVAELIDYFNLPATHRLPVEQVESVARIKHGAAAVDLIDWTTSRCRRASKEKRAGDKLPLIKVAIDGNTAPFSIIDAAVKRGEDLLLAMERTGVAKAALDRYVEEHLLPFVDGRTPTRPDPSQPTSLGKTGSYSPLGWGVEVGAIAAGDILAHKATHGSDAAIVSPEEEATENEIANVRAQSAKALARRRRPGRIKQAIFSSPALMAALGGATARVVGQSPKEKSELIEDEWLDLEDPKHQNEIRKIRAHAMLNGMLTDPDDPISGHDPDSVISAYNEISSLAPRVSEQSAAMRPLLQRRLQGNVQPFEAKEITDIEKGLSSSRQPTPSGRNLLDAPDSILG